MTERARVNGEYLSNIDEMSPSELRFVASLCTDSFGRFLRIAKLHRAMADVQLEHAEEFGYPDVEEWRKTVEAFDKSIEYTEQLEIALALGLDLPLLNE